MPAAPPTPQYWALVGYDMDRSGIPGVGPTTAMTLLEGNPSDNEVGRISAPPPTMPHVHAAHRTS